METLVEIDRLKPYFTIAELEARKSKCLQKRTAALIVRQGFDIDYMVEYNRTVSDCCGKDNCVRERLLLPSGQRSEVGAEIHASIAVLIKHGPKVIGDGWLNNYFIYVAFNKNGRQLFPATPCAACVKALKFAGYKYIFIKSDKDAVIPLTVASMLEVYEIEQREEIDGNA